MPPPPTRGTLTVTTSEPEELGQTAPVEPSAPEPASPPPAEPQVSPPSVNGELSPADTVRPGVTYVPLAVTVGDGFKFGCGFFMALVLAMLIGFVLLSALFALTSLIGLNLPLTR